jgi:capsular exopolysaccharide synthesis family protein
LGLIAVALAETSDRKLRKVEDLERLAGSPGLGVIPDTAFSGNSPTPSDMEAFHTLQAALTYFNVDHPQRSIIVSSAAKGDGKTTVAIQLALASARAGANVILVDADLRHPQIAGRLGMAARAGLASVLAGIAAPEDALTSYRLPEALKQGSLRVLASSETPPNPAQLLASDRMRALLEHLPSDVDRVIIDTSPALMVADSFALFPVASGALIVARMDRTYKDAVRRLAWTIRNAGGTVLGTVATGVATRSSYGRYDYGYVPQPASDPAAGNGAAVQWTPARRGRIAGLFRRNGRAARRESEARRVGSPS